MAAWDFKKVLNGDVYETEDSHKASGKLGFFKNSLSYIGSLNRQLHLQFNETGFIQMILIDAHGFDRNDYNFGFVKNDFLGSVPTMVFDVEPSKGSKRGRFFGRIWVERAQRERSPLQWIVRRHSEGLQGVLPLRLMAHQRAGKPLAAHQLLCRRERFSQCRAHC